MQYILSESELNDLVHKNGVIERNTALETARKIIINLTNYPCGKDYCDMCPISEVGSLQNDRPNSTTSRLICKKPRRYSK